MGHKEKNIQPEVREILRRGFANKAKLAQLAKILNDEVATSPKPELFRHHTGNSWNVPYVSAYSCKLGYCRKMPGKKNKPRPQNLIRTAPPTPRSHSTPEQIELVLLSNLDKETKISLAIKLLHGLADRL
jgi:hypothetical protein